MFALRLNAVTDLRPAWKPRQKRVPGTGHPLPSSTLRLRARKSRCLYSVYFESIPPCTSPAHLGFYHDIWTACLARSTQSFLLSWQRAVPLFIQLHSKSQFYFLQYLVPLVLVSNPYPFWSYLGVCTALCVALCQWRQQRQQRQPDECTDCLAGNYWPTSPTDDRRRCWLYHIYYVCTQVPGY